MNLKAEQEDECQICPPKRITYNFGKFFEWIAPPPIVDNQRHSINRMFIRLGLRVSLSFFENFIITETSYNDISGYIM